MSVINIPLDEQPALKALDIQLLKKLITQCLCEERPDALRILRLESCGPFIASRSREYARALAAHGKAKAAKKRAETEYQARCAGDDLEHAVGQMKDRMKAEEKEGQLFYVDDLIRPPQLFTEHLAVKVSYRWRSTIEDQWNRACITFTHDVDSRTDYTTPPSKRKPSAAKQALDRQERLYREWGHLMKLGLHSVKQYFREGGDGTEIPQTFQAKVDTYTRRLNNFSADFWQ
ncbi:hypothetical protein [Dyella subtropica]|uniref:hypothetical protein n=1 Tax=Dyella subtropica TaxID=2992127 RepID=UPI002250225A|nr:hypothetical protein [Dyella subtropica]